MEQFKHLGQTLDQIYDDSSTVHHDFKRAQRVWGILGIMIITKEVVTKVVMILYRAVVQAVLLFGSDS